MMTKFLLFALFMIIFSSSIPDSHAGQCQLQSLETLFEEMEYVFHGKVLDKNYFTWDLNPIVTFEILELFKGNNDKQITVSVDEGFDLIIFEEDLEYVVFVYRDWLFLKTEMCIPKFYAFPRVIEHLRNLNIPDNDINNKDMSFLHNYTSSEFKKFVELEDIVEKKRVQRYDSISTTHSYFVLVHQYLIYLILITGSIVACVYIINKRRKMLSSV